MHWAFLVIDGPSLFFPRMLSFPPGLCRLPSLLASLLGIISIRLMISPFMTKVDPIFTMQEADLNEGLAEFLRIAGPLRVKGDILLGHVLEDPLGAADSHV
jgi:hypothetical protein